MDIVDFAQPDLNSLCTLQIKRSMVNNAETVPPDKNQHAVPSDGNAGEGAVFQHSVWTELMPIIKEDGKCRYCDSLPGGTHKDDLLLTCCCCQTAYHGLCLLNKHGWRNDFSSKFPDLPNIVNMRALLQSQNAGNFGKAAWSCEPCQASKALCNRNLTNERIARLEANILLEQKNNKILLNKLENIDTKISAGIYTKR